MTELKEFSGPEGYVSPWHLNGLPDPVSGLSIDSMRGSEGIIEAYRQNPDTPDEPPGVFHEELTDPRTDEPYVNGTPAKIELARTRDQLDNLARVSPRRSDDVGRVTRRGDVDPLTVNESAFMRDTPRPVSPPLTHENVSVPQSASDTPDVATSGVQGKPLDATSPSGSLSDE